MMLIVLRSAEACLFYLRLYRGTELLRLYFI